ncbi:hypothetical protein [Mycetocola miduiensis]|uniref:Alkaline shock response membrane anchor protein AmaP n=1 Tax=Mycetocola miduiensis TaxID=995034 RepID=A0A1I4ZVK4_9MICO|nr:hypothetical protein [Mycetocola miduiensis]SFN54228.1 hypothetical protein SAMN05216219_1112 [Mycetocola miduiensis]
MNSTNRFANRLLLLLVGLTAVVLGAAAIGLATSPALAEGWDEIAPGVLTGIETLLQGTTATQSSPNWFPAGAVAVLLLGIVLLAIFILRQGRGRTNRLIVNDAVKGGTTIIDAAVAADILNEVLSRQPGLVASHVSAYKVHRTPILSIQVTCRRGASPQIVGDIVDSSLNDLEIFAGTEIPAVVQIRGGFRTRHTAPDISIPA